MTVCSSCTISVSLFAALAKSPFWSSEPSCQCGSTPSWVRMSSFLTSVPSAERKRKKKVWPGYYLFYFFLGRPSQAVLRQQKKKKDVFPLELRVFYSRSSRGIVVKNIFVWNPFFGFSLMLPFKSILNPSAARSISWTGEVIMVIKIRSYLCWV